MPTVEKARVYCCYDCRTPQSSSSQLGARSVGLHLLCLQQNPSKLYDSPWLSLLFHSGETLANKVSLVCRCGLNFNPHPGAVLKLHAAQQGGCLGAFNLHISPDTWPGRFYCKLKHVCIHNLTVSRIFLSFQILAKIMSWFCRYLDPVLVSICSIWLNWTMRGVNDIRVDRYGHHHKHHRCP